MEADTVFICSDIDGLYTADPRKHADASLIPEVASIDDSIYGNVAAQARCWHRRYDH